MFKRSYSALASLQNRCCMALYEIFMGYNCTSKGRAKILQDLVAWQLTKYQRFSVLHAACMLSMPCA